MADKLKSSDKRVEEFANREQAYLSQLEQLQTRYDGLAGSLSGGETEWIASKQRLVEEHDKVVSGLKKQIESLQRELVRSSNDNDNASVGSVYSHVDKSDDEFNAILSNATQKQFSSPISSYAAMQVTP